MVRMWTNNIQIVITYHAISRMKERGCTLSEILCYLRLGRVVLVEDDEGYEIAVPFKGRLAGDFDQGFFVVKTFLFPFNYGKAYNVCCQKTRSQRTVRVISVGLPTKTNFSKEYLVAQS